MHHHVYMGRREKTKLVELERVPRVAQFAKTRAGFEVVSEAEAREFLDEQKKADKKGSGNKKAAD